MSGVLVAELRDRLNKLIEKRLIKFYKYTKTLISFFQYDKGVICAGDTLGAYGGLHRFRDIRRVLKLNSNIVVTYTGDVADFQHIQEMLEDEQREYDMRDDGSSLG